MISRILRKFGVLTTTAIFTTIITSSAMGLYLLSCLFFPPVLPIGIMYSVTIPLILIPPLLYRSLTAIDRLAKSEAALQKSEHRCRMLFDQAGDAILLMQEGVFVDCNVKATQMFGIEKPALLGKTPTDLSPQFQPDGVESITKVREMLAFASRHDVPTFEWLHQKSNGELFIAEVSLSNIEMPEGDHIQAIVRDISSRKLLEQTLRQNESKYRKLFENISDAVIISDAVTEQYEDANKAALKLFGYTREEFKALHVADMTTEKIDTQKCHHHLIAGDPAFRRVPLRHFRRKDGTVFPGEIIHGVYGENGTKKIICSLRDISERIKAEEEKRLLQQHLQQAQKMEAIGTLAGGIAHDFNNILSAIYGYAELTSDFAKEIPEIKHGLDQIVVAADRARSLVRQILTFSRQEEHELKPMKIGFIVKEVYGLLRATLPATIDMKYTLEGDEGIVNANATQLHQVLMNLSTNAAQAMRDQNGSLTLSLSSEKFNHETSINGSRLEAGDYVKLTVRDTGSGISPKNLKRIFDPYFTTKEKGVGTGLGLSVVQGIVKAHGGAITVESSLGEGSSFDVYLPVIRQAAISEPQEVGVTRSGTERILLVDDEPALTAIAGQMLERLGYQVTSRTSSIEALNLFKSSSDRFDLIITDMTMPHLTGTQMAAEMHAIRPEIPVVVCTGYSEHINEESASSMGIKSLIMKPIVMREMANTIRAVLDGNKAEAA